MINIEAVSQELRIRPEIYKKILTGFCLSLPAKIETLTNAFSSSDFKKIQEVSHEIKGIASNLRVAKLKSVASDINALCAEKNLEKGKQLLEDFKREAALLNTFVKNL